MAWDLLVSCAPLGQTHKTNRFSFHFFSSLGFLWFPVPVCLMQSEKVTKSKSFGEWRHGESSSSLKSNSDQAQTEDERLSWENKLKVHEVQQRYKWTGKQAESTGNMRWGEVRFSQKRKGRRRKWEKIRKPVNTSLNFQGNYETTESLPTFRASPPLKSTLQ